MGCSLNLITEKDESSTYFFVCFPWGDGEERVGSNIFSPIRTALTVTEHIR